MTIPLQSIHIVSDTDELAKNLAEDVAKELNQAILERGQATLVVSGGSTPKPFFHYLSKTELDWDKVLITLADERCVEPGDDQSNSKLIRDYLIQNQASMAAFLPLFRGGQADQSAAEKISTKLSELPTYDVVVLGMGNDGHTASIFPEAQNRDEALDNQQSAAALLVDPVTVTPLRITQTATRLLNSRFLAVHITGREKAYLLNRVIATPNQEQWPISHFVSQEKVAVGIYCDINI